MEPSESPVSLDWSWFWIVPLLGAILLIALCIWCCCKSSFRLQDIPGVRSVLSYGTLPRTLLCQVKCYGQGKVHHEIVKKLNMIEGPGAPLVLFVYKVSRETEDLRNALQWIEGNEERNRGDIRAVILLEKSLDKQKKPVEVAHEGMFGTNAVVVRILWQQQWNSPDKILDGLSNEEAMEKVKQSILQCQ
ncbi:uncharacterized protein LOC134341188 isoform X2 [Mobula hypostoma]|uniref:uncharacterized protein LOC134341188 isoform X2 n=1 Tax=Mobula hypostoma TaxID=723540 RepID=UPI002FC2DC98